MSEGNRQREQKMHVTGAAMCVTGWRSQCYLACELNKMLHKCDASAVCLFAEEHNHCTICTVNNSLCILAFVLTIISVFYAKPSVD